jgi:fucokinase
VGKTPDAWDYLIVTASNEQQAAAYRAQLAVREELGVLAGVDRALVVPDPEGRRIGSGGSTVCCLDEIVSRALSREVGDLPADDLHRVFEALRILIIHAGGDSRRLPAYGPCGKVFAPVPSDDDSALPVTLFDRQLPIYLALPQPARSRGQVVVTSGDVLLLFDPEDVQFSPSGISVLGCHSTPQEARNHGVFCCGADGGLRRFLQKPSPQEQERCGAVDPFGQVVLDIGVMSFDASTAVRLLDLFGEHAAQRSHAAGQALRRAVFEQGLDLYREWCCALGSEATVDDYVRMVRQSGSRWDEPLLRAVFETVAAVPCRANVLHRCDFLHFGTSHQLISSGAVLVQRDQGAADVRACLDVNNEIIEGGGLHGSPAWAEGCRIHSLVSLGGENLIVGADVDGPLELPPRACLDVVPGRDRRGGPVSFIRCYGVQDVFKDTIEAGATFCNVPIGDWLKAVGAERSDVWGEDVPEHERRLWNARVFPTAPTPSDYRRWLWMFDPSRASPADHAAWRDADRYSVADMATLVDLDAFNRRREAIRAGRIRDSLPRLWRRDSGFSARELARLLRTADDRAAWVARLIAEAQAHHVDHHQTGRGMGSLVFARVIHTIGSALEEIAPQSDTTIGSIVGAVSGQLAPAEAAWLHAEGLDLDAARPVCDWAERARRRAFESLEQTILTRDADTPEPPRSRLRKDEIVWGRAPARFDTGGGWTDTPPYSLEHGGCVLNVAVNLNGQPPIQAYARVIDEPVIRIGSIDLGTRIEIGDWSQFLDYRQASSEFSLAKAALALSGLAPDACRWPKVDRLADVLEYFGGGIELTTLAAIPKGSGLGTSSIMGAVVLAVIQRVMGRALSQRELFYGVLQLEQALTTGGGWQDQIGGAVGGAKLITTEPGVVPDARIHFLPFDIIDPNANGGRTLLYYTGITRLAKNILQQVVGRYLNRDRRAMMTLRRIHALAPGAADALSRKDLPAFGRLVDVAWELNKQLDPNSTNDEVEALMRRVEPEVHGAKLLGAGGGGFLLMVCKSVQAAMRLRESLEADPPNDRARFFDFDVNTEGLVVTTS